MRYHVGDGMLRIHGLHRDGIRNRGHLRVSGERAPLREQRRLLRQRLHGSRHLRPELRRVGRQLPAERHLLRDGDDHARNRLRVDGRLPLIAQLGLTLLFV
jgi:hypothetical protein